MFDFFGTLVHYSASRTEQGYPQSHAMVRDFGADVSYEAFLASWVRVSEEFDRRSGLNHREFSMTDVCTQFLRVILGRDAVANQVAAFVDVYVGEWSAAVSHLDSLDSLLKELANRYRLAVVSNTHSPTLVPEHLRDMGLAEVIEAVVLSVEVGWRKPHPQIYRAALDRLDVEPGDAVFVGDTFDADFAAPQRLGIRSFLIDPDCKWAVPASQRLDSVFDLPARLR